MFLSWTRIISARLIIFPLAASVSSSSFAAIFKLFDGVTSQLRIFYIHCLLLPTCADVARAVLSFRIRSLLSLFVLVSFDVSCASIPFIGLRLPRSSHCVGSARADITSSREPSSSTSVQPPLVAAVAISGIVVYNNMFHLRMDI